MMSPAPDRSFWFARRVCVTGASGFLGWQIVKRLVALGAKVRALSLRADASHPIHRETALEVVFGDIRDKSLAKQAAADCSIILHAAGFVSGWGRMARHMWTVHVDGTRNMLEAAMPGARFVHTSSITTIGACADGQQLSEDAPFDVRLCRIAYVNAKRAAEDVALRAAGQGADIVVTNPGYLVGPEDYERSIMGRFCVRFWKGRVPVAPLGGLNLVDVRDAASGHLLAAEHGQRGQRYILGGENRSFVSLMKDLSEVAGYSPRAFPRAPQIVVAAVAAFSEARGLITNREPYPSLDHARLTSRCWYGTSRRARDELGYRSRPVIESLRDAYAWHHARDPIHPRGINRWWVRPRKRH